MVSRRSSARAAIGRATQPWPSAYTGYPIRYAACPCCRKMHRRYGLATFHDGVGALCCGSWAFSPVAPCAACLSCQSGISVAWIRRGVIAVRLTG
jgi:hypothetical protein